MTFAPLRGFRDYLPPDAGARSAIRSRMREAARRAGFVELETPSVESLELYRVKSGESIGEELWTFVDKGDRPVALAAETTPSLARVFVDRAKSEPMPVKWFTVSKLWRYEEPQLGRTREFFQFNLDLLGVAGIEAEVELLSTAALILDASGAEGLYEFRVNDRELAEGLGRRRGATDLPGYFRAIDRARKLPRPEIVGQLEASGLSKEAAERTVDELATGRSPRSASQAREALARIDPDGLPAPSVAALERLTRLFELAGPAGIADRIAYDPGTVRGLAYYTSTIFEAFARSGEGRSIFGGGRYDRLVELFGGPPTPAVGLAIGDQTLENLLKSHGRWPSGEPGLDTYVIAVTPAEAPVALEIARHLRAQGTSADLDLLGRSLSRQLREAARRNARRAILVGPQELARGMVVERDLTTGEQRERPRSSFDGRAAPPGPA
ncbi:MAG TPA: histidine--tRNA ligase [Thermoplasmata archaeon]|nr:histidine--tRNA ligase [Thermoplasmata archaeon]